MSNFPIADHSTTIPVRHHLLYHSTVILNAVKDLRLPLRLSTWPSFRIADNPPRIQRDGYLLDSGRPNRLWFRLFLRIGMDDLIQGNGIDCDGLLREPEEEFASAL